MLISCKECGLQVSDKALTCPHCGYPQNTAANSRKYQQTGARKRLRLPNGFGQITELKNQALRNRFRVMVTVGRDKNGRPISKTIKPVAYFKTYNEAYAALVEFNKNKPNLRPYEMTVEDVYEEWCQALIDDGHTKSYMKAVRASWNYCQPIAKIPITEIKTKALKTCILESDTTSNFKIRIKSTLSVLFDYARELEYIDRNPVKNIRLPRAISEEGTEAIKPHSSFSKEEIDKLWNKAESDPYIKMVLIQCYSGWRPGELVDLRMVNVDVENWTFKGGMKTKAGKDRIVPIHSKIREFVKFFYDRAIELNSLFLFTTFDLNTKCGYSQYYKMFERIKTNIQLDAGHRPHDPRKFFITEAKRVNMDEYAIKRIVGHTIDDITESVYTERDVEWLRSEIEKI